tara:strand:+ start:40 stop:276 length:237 start_codon:yes stop_codon:yes gene_type:complete
MVTCQDGGIVRNRLANGSAGTARAIFNGLQLRSEESGFAFAELKRNAYNEIGVGGIDLNVGSSDVASYKIVGVLAMGR